jgi:hypothetical protein
MYEIVVMKLTKVFDLNSSSASCLRLSNTANNNEAHPKITAPTQ